MVRAIKAHDITFCHEIERSEVIGNKCCVRTWLFDEFYRALNEYICLKVSQRGHRCSLMGLLDPNKSRCVVGPNACFTK